MFDFDVITGPTPPRQRREARDGAASATTHPEAPPRGGRDGAEPTHSPLERDEGRGG
jgi:hypothetical protein